MPFHYDGGYLVCPFCGNNGDQGTFSIDGTVWVSLRRQAHFIIEEMYDECCIDSAYIEDTWDEDCEEEQDREFDSDYTCDHCLRSFSEFHWCETHDQWIEEWGGPEAVVSRKSEVAAKKRGENDAGLIKMHLQGGNNAAAKEIASRIRTTQELDRVLDLVEEGSFTDYGIWPKGHPETTIPRSRLFEIGRELAGAGFRQTDPHHGEYTMRIWNVRAFLDDELELDMSTEKAKNHTVVRMTIWKEIPMVGMVPANNIFFMVQKVEERQEGKDDPDDQIVIVDLPEPLFSKHKQHGAKMDIWPGELIEEMTFYHCERSRMTQTLEVVFDITERGHLPLLKEKPEELVVVG